MNPVVFPNLQILIVDGKRINAKLLSDVLTGLGVNKITVATDTTMAMTSLHQKLYDAVFFDDAVGPLSPVEFVTALRKDTTIERHQVPCILMSAAPERKKVEMARDAGFNDFIVVPVSINTVKAKLTTVLTAPKQFINSDAFSGPDRRRRKEGSSAAQRGTGTPGQRRRESDGASSETASAAPSAPDSAS